MGRYCNREWETKRLADLLGQIELGRPERTRSKPVTARGAKRLPPRVHTEIVDNYQVGMSVKAIAEQLGLSKTTIINHLNRDGIRRRPRSMSLEQVEQAVTLYELGLSLEKVGKRLGFTAWTVLRELRKRGVTIRDTHGRNR